MKFYSLCYHYIRKPSDEINFPRILGTKITDFEDNIREFKTTTYGLEADKINKLKSNSTKFGDVKSKYSTFELTENDLKLR